MTPERAVVDASVLVKVLLDPTTPAEGLSTRLASAQLHAPDHVAVEVISALRRLRISGRIAEPEARLALLGFWSLTIQLWRLELLAERMWQLGHSLSSYDAAYVALAERLDVPLLTADKRLAGASGPRCAIEVFG